MPEPTYYITARQIKRMDQALDSHSTGTAQNVLDEVLEQRLPEEEAKPTAKVGGPDGHMHLYRTRYRTACGMPVTAGYAASWVTPEADQVTCPWCIAHARLMPKPVAKPITLVAVVTQEELDKMPTLDVRGVNTLYIKPAKTCPYDCCRNA